MVFLVLFCSLANASEWGVSDLLQTLAQTKSGRAYFVEKKYISILDKPVESSGELTFTAPDRLEKKTTKPKIEQILLEGDKLTVQSPDQRKLVLSLQAHPEVAPFVESIRGTLSGDRASLEKYYKLELQGSSEKWRLTLTPQQPSMLTIVRVIRISGLSNSVKIIEFDLADGDRLEMLISVAPQQ